MLSQTRQVPPSNTPRALNLQSTNTNALNPQNTNHRHLFIISTIITRSIKDSHTLTVRSRLHFTYLSAYLKDFIDLLTCLQRLLCSSCATPSVYVREHEPPFGKLKEHLCMESMKDYVIRYRLRLERPD
ncbi:hypothetical protein DPX16_0634 [Anabarilius grahami]|uniref:Uncharacterized protein n=1 Tax=Anabarilius grahami TaxID=495550 RepID=A0A3N0XQ20_ANAGA|nr:hypothetical protein DPX16_0634 [Anabarilius grahami]